MPHAPSAVASCEWGYDAVARLRRAVGSTLVLGRRYTPHAVGSTLVLGRDAGGSGVPPARRQQGVYRVTAECRRSATMSAVMVTMWG